jgi:hypothetical protein
MPWTAHPYLTGTALASVRCIIDRTPPNNLLDLVAGEVFENPSNCFERLQDYTFSKGFLVVTRGTATSGNQTTRFICAHHGKETRNCRELNDDITATSNRTLATSIRKKGCAWGMYVSYRGFPNRGSPAKAWQLGVTNKEHTGHDMVPNPLTYIEH